MDRSSRPAVFYEELVLRNLLNVKGKNLQRSRSFTKNRTPLQIFAFEFYEIFYSRWLFYGTPVDNHFWQEKDQFLWLWTLRSTSNQFKGLRMWDNIILEIYVNWPPPDIVAKESPTGSVLTLTFSFIWTTWMSSFVCHIYITY